jgi:hypothetical protein
MSEKISETYAAALAWLMNGFRVLPVQPNSKILVAGFGLYRGQLTLDDADAVRFWFQDRSLNLAVLSPDGFAVLDFDDAGVYHHWRTAQPEAARSYTEKTPRGGAHVFIRLVGEPVTFTGIQGLELKRVVLAYPSRVGGKPYEPLNRAEGRILEIDIQKALQGFGAMGRPKPQPQPPARVLGFPVVMQGHKLGIITEAKQKWPILNYLIYFAPRLRLAGSGRWRSGLCPWHEDKRASLWVDSERGLWGCHACGAHGDVINWHARLKGYDIPRAARDLLKMAQAVRVAL